MMTLIAQLVEPFSMLEGPARLVLGVVLKSSLILAIALTVAAAAVRASAAIRHLVLLGGLMASLLIPLAAAILPAVPLPLLPAPSVERAAVAVPDDRSTTAAVPTAAPVARAETAPSAGVSDPAAPVGDRPPPPVGLVVLGLSLCGTLLLMGYLGLGIVQVRLLRNRSDALTRDPEWSSLLERLRDRLGIARQVSLRESSRVRVPLAVGAVHPQIVLPSEAASWSDEERRAVLLHELGHVKRCDWPAQIAARLVCCLYWFNPLAWLATRHLLVEAERACDDIVVTGGIGGAGYARQLLDLASRRRRELPTFGAVAMARRGTLSRRVRAILDPSQRRGAPRRGHVFAAAGVALLLLLGLGPARVVHSDPGDRGPDDVRPAAAEAEVELDERDFEPPFDPRIEAEGRRAYEEAPALLRAVLRSDRAAVRRLLSEGADPNRGPADLGSPLTVAAALGQADVASLLLEAGADPERTQPRSPRWPLLPRSPLGAAAQSGNPATVELLLEAGAAVDFAPTGDAPPLHLASRYGHEDNVELLLAAGADPNRVTPGDGTALIAAVRTGDREVVEMLLEAGAEADHWVDGDESPLYHAVTSGREDLVQVLLDAGADPTRPWPGDGNALAVAAETGNRAILERLLSHADEHTPPVVEEREPTEEREPAEEELRRFSAGPQPWLVIDAVRHHLFVPDGSVIEVVGTGSLELPAGEVEIAIPAGHRVVVDGQSVEGRAEITGDPVVRILSPDGVPAWRLREVSWSALEAAGSRIEDTRLNRSARIDSPDAPTRFYIAVDESGRVTYLEPES